MVHIQDVESIQAEVKKRLSELYRKEDGWQIKEVKAPEGFPAPDFLVARGKHIVLVEVREERRITYADLDKLDKLREMFLAISAIIYYKEKRQVDTLIEKDADRLGIRLIPVS